jgi:hypothetical protein
MNPNGVIIHYRYVDGDQQVHEDEYFDQRYSEHYQYKVGDEVSLLYSRWFPQISSIATAAHQSRQLYRHGGRGIADVVIPGDLLQGVWAHLWHEAGRPPLLELIEATVVQTNRSAVRLLMD